MKLSEIAEILRETMTEKEIVSAIKNREIIEIEENYTVQKNYPNGVYIYSSDEEGGVLFGTTN